MPVDQGERSSPSPELGRRVWGERKSPKLQDTHGLLHSGSPHCEDPAVFPSERGTPLRMERQGGGPQEMDSARGRASSLRAHIMGRAGAGPALPTEASLRATCPTLEISGWVHRALGTMSLELDVSRCSRGPQDFLETTLPTRTPPPAKAECPRQKQGPGASKGRRPQFHARWSGPGRAGPTPTDRFSRGDSGLCPPWAAKESCFGSNCPTLPRGCKLPPSGFNSLNSGLNTPRRDCDLRDLSPPELEPLSP